MMTTITRAAALPGRLRANPRGVYVGREARRELLRTEPAYYVGVDLGQMEDYTAVAVIERLELVRLDEAWRDPATRAARTETLFALRWVRRIPLGTPYPEVVERIARLTRTPPLSGPGTFPECAQAGSGGRTQVIVDSTGVGQPVVELLRRHAGLPRGTRVVGVSITAGQREHSSGESGRHYFVPKCDLLGGLQLALQQGRLLISRDPGCGEVRALADELREMTVRVDEDSRGYAHLEGLRKDDLVLALALAWWRAGREAGFGAR